MRFSEMVFKSLAASIESMMVVYSVSISGSTGASQDGGYVKTEGSGVDRASCWRHTRHLECFDGHFHHKSGEPFCLMVEGVDQARLSLGQDTMTAMVPRTVLCQWARATLRYDAPKELQTERFSSSKDSHDD